MTTSFQVLPPSLVTARPFHTQPGDEAGLRSLAPTTAFRGSFGLTAAHISSLEPGVWLPRATQRCSHDALMACSGAPRPQSRVQPPASAGCGEPGADGEDGDLFDEQPASRRAARARRVRTRSEEHTSELQSRLH